MLTKEIKAYIDKSVLCWLATASVEHVPNVSPKEIFTHYGDEEIIIANIASPKTLRNIRQNPQVCISFIDIFVQKGFQLKGTAQIVKRSDPAFEGMEAVLNKMTAGLFPFNTITCIRVEQHQRILAPRYLLYPETTEAQQIAQAKKAYGV